MSADTSVPTLPRPAVVGGLLVGVVAVSSAAVLIRLADAPALAIAFWRTLGGTVALAPLAWGAARRQPPPRRLWSRMVASGVLLALHFALWIGSLSYTTVASSVTLVTMSPLFVAFGAARFLGEAPSRRTWLGMATTMVGAVVIGLGDLVDIELGVRALIGDLMALGGAVAVAGYLLIGRSARRQVPTSVYASVVYGTAALVLAAASLLAGAALGGYPAGTWLALLGLVVGPQLLGHTVFNALLSTVTATLVSIVVLSEPVGATLLAWLALGETPAALFWVGAPLILAGVAIATTREVPEL